MLHAFLIKATVCVASMVGIQQQVSRTVAEESGIPKMGWFVKVVISFYSFNYFS